MTRLTADLAGWLSGRCAHSWPHPTPADADACTQIVDGILVEDGPR